MTNLSAHISHSRSILIMLVVLFSLSPCSVKESVYQIFGTEYQRPVNKTKTTPSFQNTCQLQVFSAGQDIKISKISDFDLVNLADQSFHFFIAVDLIGHPHKRSEFTVRSGPLLFILYKRLKLGLS